MSEIGDSTHGTGFNQNPEVNVEYYNRIFDKHDSGSKGYLTFYELKFALAEVNVHFSHPYIYYKLISDLQKTTNGQVSFFLFVSLANQQKEEADDESDIQDAFVAMGGNEDESGCIDANKLIGTIKNDQKMTIDIEKMILEVDEDGSGEIEYDEFKLLLESEGDHPEIDVFKSWFCNY